VIQENHVAHLCAVVTFFRVHPRHWTFQGIVALLALIVTVLTFAWAWVTLKKRGPTHDDEANWPEIVITPGMGWCTLRKFRFDDDRDCVQVHDAIVRELGPSVLQPDDVVRVGLGDERTIRAVILYRAANPCTRIRVVFDDWRALRSSKWIATVETVKGCTPPPKATHTENGLTREAADLKTVVDRKPAAPKNALARKVQSASSAKTDPPQKPSIGRDPEPSDDTALPHVAEEADPPNAPHAVKTPPVGDSSDLVERWGESNEELFAYQLASNCDFSEASANAERLRQEGWPTILLQRESLWVTMAGEFPTRSEANARLHEAENVLKKGGKVRNFGEFCSDTSKIGDGLYLCESKPKSGICD
jgi:hypothetical protein